MCKEESPFVFPWREIRLWLAILTLEAAAGSVESFIMEIKEELRLCGFFFYVLKISE